jgi:hypothetical protein
MQENNVKRWWARVWYQYMLAKNINHDDEDDDSTGSNNNIFETIITHMNSLLVINR